MKQLLLPYLLLCACTIFSAQEKIVSINSSYDAAIALMKAYLIEYSSVEDAQSETFGKTPEQVQAFKESRIKNMQDSQEFAINLVRTMQNKQAMPKEIGLAFGRLIGFNRTLALVTNENTQRPITKKRVQTLLLDPAKRMPLENAMAWHSMNTQYEPLTDQEIRDSFETIINDFSTEFDTYVTTV